MVVVVLVLVVVVVVVLVVVVVVVVVHCGKEHEVLTSSDPTRAYIPAIMPDAALGIIGFLFWNRS